MSIIDLKPGDQVTLNVLLANVVALKTHKQADYANLRLQDATGELSGIDWNMSHENANLLKSRYVGEIMTVSGAISLFNDTLQISIDTITKASTGDVDPSHYLPSAPLSRATIETYISQIRARISTTAPTYAEIITKVLANHAPNGEFYTQPAAKNIHHNYHGGLSYHVYRMLQHAERLANPTPLYGDIDLDLLETAIILHDVGKLQELTNPITHDYTTSGRLLGHISIADGWLVEAIGQLPDVNLDQENILRLRHCILAHHGQLDWGSPVVPMLPEAQMLHYIDNMDAHQTVYETALANQTPGELGLRNFALGNVMPYRALDPESPENQTLIP